MRKDKLGQEITVGAYVAYTTASTGIQFDKVQKIAPKQVRLHCGSCIYKEYLLVLTEGTPEYANIIDKLEQNIKDRADAMAELGL
jgi:hypothetical protein